MSIKQPSMTSPFSFQLTGLYRLSAFHAIFCLRFLRYAAMMHADIISLVGEPSYSLLTIDFKAIDACRLFVMRRTSNSCLKPSAIFLWLFMTDCCYKMDADSCLLTR